MWPLATLVIGLGTGWFAGRQGAEAAGANAGREAAASKMEHIGSGRDGGSGGEERNGRGSRGSLPGDPKELAEAVRAIFRENVEERRFSMFENMLEKMKPEQLPLVVALIRENDLRGTGSAGEWSRLWANWGKRDPQGAMEFVRTHDWTGWSRDAPTEAKNRTLSYWAQTDPESARKFVEEGKELAEGDRSMVYGLVRGWSTVDPEATAQWLFKSGLGMGDEYRVVVEAISRKSGQDGLDEWFAGIQAAGTPAKDIRGFVETISAAKLSHEPARAAEWLEPYLQESWVQEGEVLDRTARAFAQRDPKGAMEWANRLGNQEASITAISIWCQQDAQAAGQWLSDHAEAPGYSQNAATMVRMLRRSDPASARKWAETIPDQAIRDGALRMLEAK